jgi:hypothetical protein
MTAQIPLPSLKLVCTPAGLSMSKLPACLPACLHTFQPGSAEATKYKTKPSGVSISRAGFVSIPYRIMQNRNFSLSLGCWTGERSWNISFFHMSCIQQVFCSNLRSVNHTEYRDRFLLRSHLHLSKTVTHSQFIFAFLPRYMSVS